MPEAPAEVLEQGAGHEGDVHRRPRVLPPAGGSGLPPQCFLHQAQVRGGGGDEEIFYTGDNLSLSESIMMMMMF